MLLKLLLYYWLLNQWTLDTLLRPQSRSRTINDCARVPLLGQGTYKPKVTLNKQHFYENKHEPTRSKRGLLCRFFLWYFKKCWENLCSNTESVNFYINYISWEALPLCNHFSKYIFKKCTHMTVKIKRK